jgi:2-oxoisovalerate dehydrogenase E2 component (dihydrolipoyl transacylase)
MKIFKMPDLGEGLIDAEVCEWHVKVGQLVKAGDPLVTVETAKALVEIPAPWEGTIEILYADTGDLLTVNSPVVAYREAGSQDQKVEAKAGTGSKDAGSVVGDLVRGDEIVREKPTGDTLGSVGFKATPAVRALARKLNVELSIVTPSGPDGLITRQDIERVAGILKEVGPMESLRGTRRAMARTMAQAHAEVADVTVTEDADIGDWLQKTDTTLRLIRAIAAGCRAEPCLNAWYDSHAMGRRVLDKIHLGIAVDTPEGLFVAVMHDIANRTPPDLRKGLEKIKADVRARSIPPHELRGYTITLSNYGSIGGRYSDPIVVPPTVAILGAGRIREQVLPHRGQPSVRRVIPLSLTFDHRVVTGGEATRFLMAVVNDLSGAE